MNPQPLSVGKRLSIGFGLVLAILIVVTMIALVNVNAINTALRANSDEHMSERGKEVATIEAQTITTT